MHPARPCGTGLSRVESLRVSTLRASIPRALLRFAPQAEEPPAIAHDPAGFACSCECATPRAYGAAGGSTARPARADTRAPGSLILIGARNCVPRASNACSSFVDSEEEYPINFASTPLELGSRLRQVLSYPESR